MHLQDNILIFKYLNIKMLWKYIYHLWLKHYFLRKDPLFKRSTTNILFAIAAKTSVLFTL